MNRAALEFALLSAACLLMGACSGAAPRPSARPPAPTASSAPQLAALVVFDQLGSDTLTQLLPSLSPEGALRTLAATGAYHERVYYPYAGTFTAPGHATIHTGTVPAEHGVTCNERWDYERQTMVYAINDGVHPVLGRPSTHAGPGLLKVENVADSLKRQTGGAGRVVSLSLKDRAAILGGGQSPDLVLWYDHKIPGFTTSAYYARALPEWLVAWQDEHPLTDLLKPWTTQRGAIWGALLGPDQQAGEGDWDGLGTTFPHDLAGTRKPYSTLRAAPQLGERLLALGERAVAEYGLGRDDVPDLLTISISGTDYAGHALGPDSWEYAEHLYRVDLALGHMLARLAARTRLAVLITADHGSAENPERSGRGGRIDPARLQDELDGVLDGVLGPGDWVRAYLAPFVYLTTAARNHPQRRSAMRALVAHLQDHPGFDSSFDVQALLASTPPRDDDMEAAFLSAHAQGAADLLLIPTPEWIVNVGMAPGAGSTHGTPHPYDAEVPVLVGGPNVDTGRDRSRHDMRQVAPTVMKLLGLDPPAKSTHAPLEL